MFLLAAINGVRLLLAGRAWESSHLACSRPKSRSGRQPPADMSRLARLAAVALQAASRAAASQQQVRKRGKATAGTPTGPACVCLKACCLLGRAAAPSGGPLGAPGPSLDCRSTRQIGRVSPQQPFWGCSHAPNAVCLAFTTVWPLSEALRRDRASAAAESQLMAPPCSQTARALAPVAAWLSKSSYHTSISAWAQPPKAAGEVIK